MRILLIFTTRSMLLALSMNETEMAHCLHGKDVSDFILIVYIKILWFNIDKTLTKKYM